MPRRTLHPAGSERRISGTHRDPRVPEAEPVRPVLLQPSVRTAHRTSHHQAAGFRNSDILWVTVPPAPVRMFSAEPAVRVLPKVPAPAGEQARLPQVLPDK